MKTTISLASAGLAIILAFPMTAQAHDHGSYGQRGPHHREQPVEEAPTSSGARPAFENQQRILQEGQAKMERDQDNRYHAQDNFPAGRLRDRNYYQYREYREYRDDRQEGRNRRRNQRRYRQHQYRGDWH